jgi:hypothetical protein
MASSIGQDVSPRLVRETNVTELLTPAAGLRAAVYGAYAPASASRKSTRPPSGLLT